MQSKDTIVYVANFRHSQWNKNLQGTFRELRILKFCTNQRLIAQDEGKIYKIINF